MSIPSDLLEADKFAELMLALSRKALENAKDLLNDAELLFANSRWPRTIFLSQIAGEEIGKYLITRGAYLQNCWQPNSVDWKKIIKQVRNHFDKSITITLFEDIALTEPPLDLTAIKAQTKELELGKQSSLYADFIGGAAQSPHELWPESVAANALKWARGRVNLATAIETQTPRLELVARESLAAFIDKWPALKTAVNASRK